MAQPIATRWPEVPLDSLLVFLTSGSRGWAEYYADSGSLFLRIQNVGRNQILLDDVAYVSAPDTAESNRTRVQPGDVLLSITADLGRTAVVPDHITNAFINQHLAILRTKNVHPQYLSAFLSSPAGQRQILSRNRHGVKAGLNFDDIRSFQIPIPPLAEQRRIAEVLDRADGLRTKRRAAIAELNTLTQSIFADLFGAGFAAASLADLCDLITDGTHYTPEYAEAGIPFLSARSVTSGHIDWKSTKFIPESLHRELQKRVSPRLNDILLAKNGTTGIAAIVDRELPFDIYVSLALLRVGPRVLPAYLHGAINSTMCRHQFDSALKGIGVPNLHLKDIRKTQVPCPPLDLQQEFARRVAAVDKLKSTHRTSLANLDELFASLQHRAFEGEL